MKFENNIDKTFGRDFVVDLDYVLTLNERDFISECYIKLLTRLPDEGGRIFYEKKLALGVDRLTIVADIFRSAEAARLRGEALAEHSAIFYSTYYWKIKAMLFFGWGLRPRINSLESKLDRLEASLAEERQRFESFLGHVQISLAALQPNVQVVASVSGQTESAISEYDEISESGVFDIDYYLDTYKDVADSGVHPLVHFLNDGWKEGRNPSSAFDTKYYLSSYRDVADSGVNPLLHFVRNGRAEGRVAINPEVKPDLGYVEQIFRQDQVFETIKGAHPIDIIVPIYNGFQYLEPLFHSLDVNTRSACRIIAIDDKSPDARVSEFLKNLEFKNPNLSLVKVYNEQNLGFVKTVNKGVELVKNHFVILNTDVEVPDFWVERLMRPIFEMDKVGSTTPFTNSGTICSFPNYLEDNEIATGQTVDFVDGYFRNIVFADTYIEIPTGVGFCMGVNLNVVREIGMFDEVFGKGYSEENDWSMRSKAIGYRNIHVTNLFVYHKHGGSFSSEDKKRLQKENYERLVQRHPTYNAEVQAVVAKDELKNIRSIVARMIDRDIRASDADRRQLIYYVGHLSSSSGVGNAARGNISALDSLQYDLKKFDLSDHSWFSAIERSFAEDLPAVVVFHITANEMLEVAKSHHSRLMAMRNVSKLVGVWAWESDAPSADFKPASIYLEEIWPISSYVQTALVGIECRNAVVNHVVEISDQVDELSELKDVRAKHDLLIGYMFDLNSYVFRKNPEAAIGAFKRAKSANPNAALVLKISGAEKHPSDYRRIKSLCEGENIYLLEGRWSEGGIRYFYKCLDVYLALFRAEGFGLTIAEAMAAGVAVICPKYSGITDFAEDGVAYVPFSTISVPADWGPYKKGTVWADPSVDDAAVILRELMQNTGKRQALSLRGKNIVAKNLSVLAIASRLDIVLSDLLRIR